MRNWTRIVTGVAALQLLATATTFAAQDPEDKKPESKSKTPTAIVAGRSFGRLKLGMTKKEIVKMLGKPNTEAALEDDRKESIWYGNAAKSKGLRKTDYVAVYFENNKAVQIEGSTPRFKTKSGLTTDHKWSDFTKKITTKDLRKRMFPMDPAEPRMLHFALDDSESGIGIEQMQYESKKQNGPKLDEPIDLIVVHRPGSRLLFGICDFTLWRAPHEKPKGEGKESKPEKK